MDTVSSDLFSRYLWNITMQVKRGRTTPILAKRESRLIFAGDLVKQLCLQKKI